MALTLEELRQFRDEVQEEIRQVEFAVAKVERLRAELKEKCFEYCRDNKAPNGTQIDLETGEFRPLTRTSSS